MTAPRIGITRSGPADAIPRSYQSYHRRIVEAGGEPVDLHPGLADSGSALVDGLDGVIIAGGPDVLPARYAAETHPLTDDGDPARDDLEFGVLDEALRRDLPVLAICRGHQLLNVAFGGGLLQHIESDGHRAFQETPGEGDYVSRWHDVAVEPGSKLGGLIGEGTIHVNSRHHQAVLAEMVPSSLRVTATSPDGLIEGLESDAHRWVVAVQWHPERDEMAERFRPLFAAFVAEAAAIPATSGD